MAAAVLILFWTFHSMAVYFGSLMHPKSVWPVFGMGEVRLVSEIHPFGACFSLENSPDAGIISTVLGIYHMTVHGFRAIIRSQIP